MKSKWVWALVPAAVTLIFGFLILFGTLSSFESSLYDMLLRVRPKPNELGSILLMDFDDQAIEEAGSWPVPRDIYGDGLILLSELGADYAVFDIEYVDESPRGVNTEFLDYELPELFRERFGDLGNDMNQLFSAIASGRISAREATSFVEDLSGRTQAVRDDLVDQVRLVAADNDEYLGRAARFFGNSFFTINMRNEYTPGADSEGRKLVPEKAAVAAEITGSIDKAVDILPTIGPIFRRAAGAGFPNVFIDPDGVRRRIQLFYQFEDKVYAQLVVAPLLHMLGSPAIRISNGHIELIGARLPDGTTADIRIPRAEDGMMLIDWPHKTFIDSFRHISFRELMVHKKLYSDLVHNLRIREDWGYLSLYDGETGLLDQARRAEAFLKAALEAAASDEVGPGASGEYRALRDSFIAEVGRYLALNPEEAIGAEVAAILEDPRLDQASREQYLTIATDAPAFFDATRKLHADLADLRGRLAKEVDGAFCVLGQTGTSTTDIGVNPFEKMYMNVGTHASVLNTIVQRRFIDDSPGWITLLIAALSSFGLALLIKNRKPLPAISIGMGWTILLAGAIVLVFALAGLYLGLGGPVLATFLTFLAATALSFLRTEREKGFLRNAFSHYLSNEVIKVIIDNPDKLKLGGDKKRMTAMFTDIRGFSTVSEKLGPVELVQLLNAYLTSMSDIILDLQGTIDKYEGDAIIAFFNAPIDLEDHAHRALLAAVKMKRVEREINAKFLSDGLAPSELLTRIGLNTGDMVVGNMGTTRKMDYTIIGDAVNLAARLEGVNKQYGTWICAAEDTVEEGGKGFLVRVLDRVRVVGKSVPIRIYDIVEEKGQASDKIVETVGLFAEGGKLFEARDWRGALDRFEAALAVTPDDGPSLKFKERCQTYIKTPPPANWDGVFNLTTK